MLSPRELLNVAVAIVITATLTAQAGALSDPDIAHLAGLEGDSSPHDFFTLNGITYFAADDGVHGDELWRTDGTPAGTRLVKDIYEGPEDSSPKYFAVVRGMLYFAVDGEQGCGLWRSDGTADGTRLVSALIAKPCGPSRAARELVNVGGRLLFTADDDLHGRELWRSDGTSAGTRIVKNISTVPDPSGDPGDTGAEPYGLTNTGGTLLFGTYRGLWRSDGTERGTRQVIADIEPRRLDLSRTRFDTVGGMILFRAGGLWRSDGTESGTYRFYDDFRTSRTVRGSAVLGDEFFFLMPAVPQQLPSLGLWKTDGSSAGTVVVMDGPPFLRHPGFAGELIASGGLVYFTTLTTSLRGLKLWASDGTPGGTYQVVDLNPDDGTPLRSDYDAQALTDVNGTLFFLGNDARGCGLWKTGGTAETTEHVSDLHVLSEPCPLAPFEVPIELIKAGSGVIFAYDDGIHGYEPYVSDGTASGTFLLKDIKPSNRVTCPGDCDSGGTVTVDEVVRGVTIALGSGVPGLCTALDTNGDGRVTVDELVAAVGAALGGCP